MDFCCDKIIINLKIIQGSPLIKKALCTLLSAIALGTSSAHATDYRLDFVASDFVIDEGDSAPPFSSASGSFVFSADSLFSQWTALKDFQMTLGDQHYAISDVGFESYGVYTLIGGLETGFNGVGSKTNDFVMELWASSRGPRPTVTYATASQPGFWISTSYSRTLTELTAAVPEPETYALLIAGLGLVGIAARRIRA